MKKYTAPFIAVAFLAGCTTLPDKEAYLPAQGSACIEQRPIVAGKTSTVRWCIASQMFQPRKYTVTLDGKTVFNGTDYTRVSFKTQTEAGQVAGQCEEHVTLVDNKSNSPVEMALIPKTTITACKIEGTANGRSTSFLKSVECDVHFYKDIGPMIGPVIPVENLRRCTLDLNAVPIFDARFTTARRF